MAAGLVTYEEAAAMLDVPVGTLYRWRFNGWLEPYCTDGGKMLFHTRALRRAEYRARCGVEAPVMSIQKKLVQNP